MKQNIKIKSTEILSHFFYPLKKVELEIEDDNGKTEEVSREVYASKNGATILLYNTLRRTVLLIRQFRLPPFLNEHPTGMLLEACAGILEDGEEPTASIIREVEEETGYRLNDVTKLFELYMTPGAVQEKLHFFRAEYFPNQQVSKGGGLKQENENLEVVELPFQEAYNLIQAGEIVDAKTVLLLHYAQIHLFDGGGKVFSLV